MSNHDATHCRCGYDDLYVHYTVKEAEDDFAYEGQNYTHVEVTPAELPDGEEEFDWMIEIEKTPNSPAIVRAFQGCDPSVYEFAQKLPEQTLRQLADMFLTAAIRMRLRDHAEEIAKAEAARKIQLLPFTALNESGE